MGLIYELHSHTCTDNTLVLDNPPCHIWHTTLIRDVLWGDYASSLLLPSPLSSLLIPVPPGPPANLQVTGQTIESLSISWTNPTFDGFSPIASFRVQVIAIGNVVGFSRDFAGDASTTSHTLGALSPFTQFTLRLFVINEVELEGQSAETTGMTDSLRKSLFWGLP